MVAKEIIIKAHNIKKNYQEKILFESLNVEIEANTLTTIFGESGSGKTTLLNLLGLLEKPNSGTIELFGVTVPKLNSRQALLERRNNVSYLFQNFGLIDDATVSQNLDLGLEYVKASKQEKKILKERALVAVNLQVKLNTKIYSLSGGEQQRVAIARALLKPSKLVLADEPTGSLDKENKEEIGDLLLSLKKQGKTVVVVSHDPYFKVISDRIIDIKDLK